MNWILPYLLIAGGPAVIYLVIRFGQNPQHPLAEAMNGVGLLAGLAMIVLGIFLHIVMTGMTPTWRIIDGAVVILFFALIGRNPPDATAEAMNVAAFFGGVMMIVWGILGHMGGA